MLRTSEIKEGLFYFCFFGLAVGILLFASYKGTTPGLLGLLVVIGLAVLLYYIFMVEKTEESNATRTETVRKVQRR